MNGFDKNTLFKIVLLCDAALVLLYILSGHLIPLPSWTVSHWFDMDSEANIPEWFSSVQLIAIASSCFIYASALDNKTLRGFYVFATAVFVFLSADEASKIHENIGGIARNSPFLDAYFSHVRLWIVIYLVVAVILGFYFRREITAFLNERAGRLTLIVGAIVYVTGAVGFESVAVYLIPPDWVLMRMAEVSFEEGFELLGQSIMLYGVMIKIDCKPASQSASDVTNPPRTEVTEVDPILWTAYSDS